MRKLKKSHEEYDQELLEKYGDEYEVLEFYKGVEIPILHYHSCGTTWKTRPNNVLSGAAMCPKCDHKVASRGNYYYQPTMLYVIKIEDKYLKIGITTKSIEARFYRENSDIKLLYNNIFTCGSIAYSIEQKVLKMYNSFRVKDKVLKSGGNTEIFVLSSKEEKSFINVVKGLCLVK